MSKTVDKAITDSTVRVRFAPSPTGDLHVGGVRTALFNYLFARHHDGRFLLRIEDTDRERSTPEAIKEILDGLAWLELNPDEEPVYQSKSIEKHISAAERMLADGCAYRCFCKPEEIEIRRKEKGEYKYDRQCFDLSEDEIKERLEREEKYAVRIIVPDGEIAFRDCLHGDMRVSCEELDDFILLRRDGTPTYMLAVVVDDIDMGITHIIRGDDHLSNTPKQILIYQALDKQLPEFAHVPLILGKDRRRLSKRHGSTSVTEYRDAGYFPETLINFLGLLGWSPGDDRVIISRQELIEHFDIKGIQSKAAVFDEERLRWLNGQYLGSFEFERMAEELRIQAKKAVEKGKLNKTPTDNQLRISWYLLRNRIYFISELFEAGSYMFQDPKKYDEKGVKKHFMKDRVTDRLSTISGEFKKLTKFDVASIENVIRIKAEVYEITAGKLIHPIRLACSGVTGGPGLFELLEALGKEVVVRRIDTAVEWIKINSKIQQEA